jgi:hypothetical protein
MATRRRPAGFDDSYFTPQANFDPTQPLDVVPDGGDYRPPNGNTGVSGYIPGGVPPPPRPEASAPTYAPIQGFDFDKLSGAKPYDSAEKYSDAVRAFSQGLGGGVKIGRNDLGGMIDYLRGAGFGNATAVGDDKIDFGDGKGAIDVINSKGEVWFQNGADRFADPATAAPGAAGPGAVPGGMDWSKLKGSLEGLFPGGAFNQDIVNRRTESAREDLERFRKSRLASSRAELADRGLIGDGPEATGLMGIEDDIADRYIGASRDIYADESENADQRMMQALSLATGMSTADAQNAIDLFRAQTERTGVGNQFTLGQGRLALDNSLGQQGYNLDLARFGLDRDRTLWDMENGSIDQFIAMLQMLMNGAQTSAGGYFK